jgi:hypothetical protein
LQLINETVGRTTKTALWLCLAWLALNLGGVAASWLRAWTTPIEADVSRVALDLRANRTLPGRTVSIIATRPTPSKGDYIGHMWIVWPETPPGAPHGTRESGYYAHDQLQAVRAMVVALLAPWGVVTGQVPVPGLIKADDGWWRHMQIDVVVDEGRYQAALAVDTRWRREARYALRPAMIGADAGRTFGCQDYVVDVAVALGLRPGPRPWAEFPMGAFTAFARANKVGLPQR